MPPDFFWRGAAGVVSDSDGVFGAQCQERAFIRLGRVAAQFFEGDIFEPFSGVREGADERPDGGVGVFKGGAFGGQIIGEFGGGGISGIEKFAHAGGIDAHGADHSGEDYEAILGGIGGIKNGFFVFLVVFIVGEGLSFNHH